VQHNEPVITATAWVDAAGVHDSRPDSDEDAFAWVELADPTPEELDAVRDEFGLDHLQLEDAANPRQRAKFEFEGGGCAFTLLKLLDYLPGTSDVVTGQVAVFVGPGFAVTVRHGVTSGLDAVRPRLEGSPNLRDHGPYGLLYAVFDAVVDAYVAVMDELADDVDEVETAVFDDAPTRMSSQAIYNLKRENQEVRRAVAPLVPSAHLFVEHAVDDIPVDLRQYFRDIGEHVLRVADVVESVDTLLLTLLMAQTALQDLQQNRDMRKISAWVAIAAVPTAIAAIYGMNFEVMPELDQPWGYPAVLGVMALTCVLLFRAFKRSGWL
jgi:magnesium transporter